ncbi:MAG: CapA family protein [Clostridiales bacterium]|nr:CapA family protein [Clostridiales bacterium]
MRIASLLLALLMLMSGAALAAAEIPPAEIFQAPKQIVVSFAGDCTLGCTPLSREHEENNFEALVEKNGLEYPFAKVREIFEQDDLTIVNLESTFYDSENNRAQKTYTFRAPTHYADILTLGSVEAVSIGNNHALDYGRAGQESTIQALEARKIGWFGTNEYASKTFIYEKDGVKIGFVAAYISYWWSKGAVDVIKADFAELEEADCDLIVACIHGGVEYDLRHDTNQEKMADRFIKYGADIIIGHHPHTIQGLRVQDGISTLWSLGNFSFGGNTEVRTMNTFIAQFTFSFDDENQYLGHQLNIIPCHVSGTEEENNFQPYPVTGKDADAVIKAIQYDVKRLKLKPYVEGVGAIQEFVPAPGKK